MLKAHLNSSKLKNWERELNEESSGSYINKQPPPLTSIQRVWRPHSTSKWWAAGETDFSLVGHIVAMPGRISSSQLQTSIPRLLLPIFPLHTLLPSPSNQITNSIIIDYVSVNPIISYLGCADTPLNKADRWQERSLSFDWLISCLRVAPGRRNQVFAVWRIQGSEAKAKAKAKAAASIPRWWKLGSNTFRPCTQDGGKMVATDLQYATNIREATYHCPMC